MNDTVQYREHKDSTRKTDNASNFDLANFYLRKINKRVHMYIAREDSQYMPLYKSIYINWQMEIALIPL